MGQLFTISLFEMKVLLAISTLMVVANAMPTQYVLVPLNQLHYIQPQYHHRVARSAWPQDGGPPGGPGAFVSQPIFEQQKTIYLLEVLPVMPMQVPTMSITELTLVVTVLLDGTLITQFWSNMALHTTDNS